MLQIRLHGRGGQGVVTAAEMLTLAAFYEGHYAQAFPSFGSERTGAPVVAYARIDNKEIRTHEPIQEPNVVLIQDKTLLGAVDVFAGLDKNGYVVINSKEDLENINESDLEYFAISLKKSQLLSCFTVYFISEKSQFPISSYRLYSTSCIYNNLLYSF